MSPSSPRPRRRPPKTFPRCRWTSTRRPVRGGTGGRVATKRADSGVVAMGIRSRGRRRTQGQARKEARRAQDRRVADRRRPGREQRCSPSSSRSFREPLEPGLVVSGEIRDPEALGDALKRFFDLHKLPKRGVRLGVSNNRIGVRIFEIEGIADAQSARECDPLPGGGSAADPARSGGARLRRPGRARSCRRHRVEAHPARRRVPGGRRPVPAGVSSRRSPGRRDRPRGVRSPPRRSRLPAERDPSAGALVGGRDRPRPHDDRRLDRTALRVRPRSRLGRLVAERRDRARARSRSERGRVDQATALVLARDRASRGSRRSRSRRHGTASSAHSAASLASSSPRCSSTRLSPAALGIGEIVLTGGRRTWTVWPRRSASSSASRPPRRSVQAAQGRPEGRTRRAAWLARDCHRPRDRGLMRAVNLLPRDLERQSRRR